MAVDRNTSPTKVLCTNIIKTTILIRYLASFLSSGVTPYLFVSNTCYIKHPSVYHKRKNKIEKEHMAKGCWGVRVVSDGIFIVFIHACVGIEGIGKMISTLVDQIRPSVASLLKKICFRIELSILYVRAIHLRSQNLQCLCCTSMSSRRHMDEELSLVLSWFYSNKPQMLEHRRRTIWLITYPRLLGPKGADAAFARIHGENTFHLHR
jgi:hypothetical protein